MNGGTPNSECTVCMCPTGYTGADCSMDIDDCAFNPCRNGGTCTVTDGGFMCECPRGRTGDNCSMCAASYTMVNFECSKI